MIEHTIISSTISLLLIWISLAWLWSDFLVDDFRQSMFNLRDELFIEAADGTISFNSPAYGMQRNTMNGIIRFAHRLSLTQIFVWQFFVGNSIEPLHADYKKRWNAALNSLDESAKKRLLNIRMRMHILVVKHCIKRSPLLVSLIIPWVLTNVAFDFLFKLFKGSFDALDAAAIVESKHHSVAC